MFHHNQQQNSCSVGNQYDGNISEMLPQFDASRQLPGRAHRKDLPEDSDEAADDDSDADPDYHPLPEETSPGIINKYHKFVHIKF